MVDHQGRMPPEDAPAPIPLAPDPIAEPPARRGIVIGAAVLVGVVAIAVIGVLAYRNLVGDPFASAEAVPADADVVIAFDLLQLRDTERLDRLAAALAEPFAEPGDEPPSAFDLVEEIDDELESEFGITLSDDIVPWIGRSVSVAMWFDADFVAEPDVLASIAVRDRAAAKATLDHLYELGLVEESGGTVQISEADGGDQWVTTEDGEVSQVVWLGDDALLIATDEATLRAAHDARQGQSLVDDPAFTDVVAELPPDRLLTVYASPDLFQSVVDLSLDMGGPDSPLTGFPIGAAGIAVTLQDNGVQFDYVDVFGDTGETRPPLEVPMAAVSKLPRDTVGYVAFTVPEPVVNESQLDDLRATDPAAFDEFRAVAADMLGADVFDDLIPSFGGDWLFAVVEARTGPLADQGVPLGVLASLGVVDPAPVATALASLEELAAEEGVVLGPGDPTVVSFDGIDWAAYSLTPTELVAGTPESVVRDYLDGSGGLTSRPVYQELDDAIVGDGLAFYLDVERVVDIIRDYEPDVPELPIRAVGASGESDGSVTRGSLLILIDY